MIRPTRFGFKASTLYLLLVLAFYAAPYLNLFFLLLAFASVLGVLNAYWSWNNTRGLRGSIGDIPPFAAGSQRAATLRVSGSSANRKHVYLSSSIEIDGAETRIADHFTVSGRETQVIPARLPALPRGVHTIHSARIGSIFPFGTLLSWRPLERPGQLVVYPKPANLDQQRHSNQGNGLGTAGHDWSDGVSIAGLREYRQGDEVRNVHWKASARRRGLVVKEVESESPHGVDIQLDLRAEHEELEHALSMISALALECAANKTPLGLRAQGHHETYGHHHQPIDQLFEYLARVNKISSSSAPPPSAPPSALRLPVHGRGERPTPGAAR